MKKIFAVLLILSTFLAACAPATPTPDVNATVNAMLSTSVAATLTAQPTDTPLPTSTPLPTFTPEPIITNTPVASETPVPTIAPPTATSVPYVGCFAPAGTGNTNMGVFRMENNTQETIEVNLHGVSLNGNVVVDCSFTITASFNTEIIFGNYTYYVLIGNKKSIEGSFNILSDDKTTMRIFDKKVVIAGP